MEKERVKQGCKGRRQRQLPESVEQIDDEEAEITLQPLHVGVGAMQDLGDGREGEGG